MKQTKDIKENGVKTVSNLYFIVLKNDKSSFKLNVITLQVMPTVFVCGTHATTVL